MPRAKPVSDDALLPFKPIVSARDKQRAVDIIRDIMEHPDGSKEQVIQLNAARAMAMLYDTERKYSPERLQELARQRPSGNVTDLTTMTPEKLAELRRKMNADFPGAEKPA